MLMSADGQHFRKDVTLLHNFTKTVRPTAGSYMTMNVLCRFNREIDLIKQVIQHKKRRIYEEDDTSEDVNGSSYVGTST